MIKHNTMRLPVSLKKDTSNGFTLAEILIAIAIFAIVMTMLFSSFNSVLLTTDAVNGRMASAQMAKSCINRVISDLQSIYVNLPPAYTPPEIDSPPESYRLVGDITRIDSTDFSQLRFTSSAHLSLGYGAQAEGIAEILYYVDKTTDNVRILRRADHLYPYEEFQVNKNDPILCENLRSLAFIYYDEEGSEYENWDSESPDYKYATPRAIRILLEIGDEETSQTYQTKIALPVYRKKIE